MKRFTTLYFLILPIALALALIFQQTLIAVALIAAGAVMLPQASACWDATLILPHILNKIIEAYKTMLPKLNYFSWDINERKPVKWLQPIIAQMPELPNAVDHVPGTDLTAGAQNVKDLITDVPMVVNQCKKVVFKVPTADAVKLILDTAFAKTLQNSGHVLAKSIITAGLATITKENFSNELVEPSADVAKETLGKARVKLNTQKARSPRFGLTNPTFMGSLTNDTRIGSNDFYSQRVGAESHVTLTGIEGFTAISEYDEFPTTNNLEAFFFDQQAILFAGCELNDTLKMARELGIPTPILDISLTDSETGMTFTAYMWIDVKTHDIYVAVITAFGFSAGRQDEENDANSLLDRSGLRVVTQASA